MALFKKHNKGNLKMNGKEIKGLHIPNDVSNDRFYKSSVLGSFILGLVEIGDEEDYKSLSEVSARTFFEKNKKVFEKLTLSSEDSLREFVEMLNNFLSLHQLGFIQVVVNEVDKEIHLKHFNSPFALTLRNKEDKNACCYLEEFYSNLFSLLLDKDIEVKEVSCAAKAEGDFCLFKFITS